MSKNVVACDKCLTKEELTTYKVEGRGYPSVFDGDRFHICLCQACERQLKVDPSWFNNDDCFVERIDEEGLPYGEYLYEQDIKALIKTLTEDAQYRIDTCENTFGLNQLYWG